LLLAKDRPVLHRDFISAFRSGSQRTRQAQFFSFLDGRKQENSGWKLWISLREFAISDNLGSPVESFRERRKITIREHILPTFILQDKITVHPT